MEKVRVRQQVEKVRTVLFSEKTLYEFCVGGDPPWTLCKQAAAN